MSAVGRVGPKRAPDSSPETCHPQVLRDKNFERVGKDRLWPGPACAGCELSVG